MGFRIGSIRQHAVNGSETGGGGGVQSKLIYKIASQNFNKKYKKSRIRRVKYRGIYGIIIINYNIDCVGNCESTAIGNGLRIADQTLIDRTLLHRLLLKLIVKRIDKLNICRFNTNQSE